MADENQIKIQESKESDKSDNRESDKSNTIKERVRIDKEEFVTIFEKHYGIITSACKEKGISRSTFYEWYKNDSDFKKKTDGIKKEQAGMVEDRLLKAILEGNISAIIFYLKCKHPEYKPKSEISFDKENIDKALDKIKTFLE